MPGRKAVLHIFCGKIASGKSTLAGEIAADAGAILIAEDRLLATLYPGEIAGLEDYVRAATRLRTALTPLIEQLLRQGRDVVLDFQANTPAGRHWFRGVIEVAGADHQLHYMRASDDCCRSRLSQRNASGHHEYGVSAEEFDLFTSYFVPPSTEEGFTVVLHDQS